MDDQTAIPARAAALAAGISYRQLDYWARTGLVEPSLVAARGSGSRRGYSIADVVALSIVAGLRTAGLQLDEIRNYVGSIESEIRHEPLPALRESILVVSAVDVELVRSPERLIELVRRAGGTALVLPLGPIVLALDEKIADARAAAGQRFDRWGQPERIYR